MAPAQILDLPQTHSHYTHKKFHGNRYAHKKFGTRSPSPPSEVHNYIISEKPLIVSNISLTPAASDPLLTNSKKSSSDIFRPYALDENTPRKRKHCEIQDTPAPVFNNMDNKRFAAAPPLISPAYLPTPQVINFPPVYPIYRQQQFHFDAQTFALILQKQQAALSMGEMLKRQTNFNLHNVIGN